MLVESLLMRRKHYLFTFITILVSLILLAASQERARARAEDDASDYYTMNASNLSGNAKPASEATIVQTQASPVSATSTISPTATLNATVTVTPQADGAIVVIVEAGQSLYSIAEAYGVTVNTLLTLNNRKLNDRLYVGDKIIVRVPYTITPTPEITDTFTPRAPTATRRPTRTATLKPPTRTPSPTTAASATASPTPPQNSQTDAIGNILLAAIVILLVMGIGLVGIGALLRNKT